MKMKKIIVLISMLAVLLSLSACGQKEETLEYDKGDLAYKTLELFDTYVAVDEDMAKYYISSGSAFEKTAVSGITQAQKTDKVGNYEDYGKYLLNFNSETLDLDAVDAKFAATSEDVTVTVINKAENRDVEVSVKFKLNEEFYIEYDKLAGGLDVDQVKTAIETYYNTDVESFLALGGYSSIDEYVEAELVYELEQSGITLYEPEEMVVSAVYTTGELIKQAALNTAIGMGTVFVVLIFISFIISMFKYLPAIFLKKPKAPEAKKEEAKPAPVAAPVQNENLMDDAELVAVITAAIYAAQGTAQTAASNDKLVVRSIRRARR